MIDLQQLGFTQEEPQNRVVDQICTQLLSGRGYDEDGDEVSMPTSFAHEIEKRIKTQIDASISALAEKHILPNVAAYIEGLVLQETTTWGEKRGEPVTFIQYLVRRAEEYLREKVNYEGKSKDEVGSYSFSPTQTRITHLVHQHLAHSIELAMKDALKVATGEVAKGIHETARLKLNEIAEKLKVTVQTK